MHPQQKGYLNPHLSKDEAIGLNSNPFLLSTKKVSLERKASIGSSDATYVLYLKTITEISELVSRKPEILDKYAISITDTKKKISDIAPNANSKDRFLYFWANPWLFVHEILGVEVLNKTTPAGANFKEFIPQQKQYLRDFLDPRVHGMIMSCCRGGSKTWLNAIGITLMEYLIPKMRITINSGSKQQSDYLYRYFTQFLEGTVLMNLVKGEPLQSNTSFKHGGWVKALTASEKSVRGLRPDTILFDETCQAEDVLVKSALGGTFTATNLKIIFSSTPNKMNHIFYEVWARHEKYGWKRYHWNCYDCPWITKDAIEMAKLMYDTNTFRIEMLGEFGSRTGSVFDHDTITGAKVDSYPDVVLQGKTVANAVGVDWGYAHPTVVTVVGIDDQQPSIAYVLEVFGKSGMKEEDWCKDVIPRLCKKYGVVAVSADSAGAFQNRALEDALASEVPGLGVSRTKFSVAKMRMIGEVRRRLEKGLLKIRSGGGAEVDKLVEQLYAYEYEYSEATGMAGDKPAKGNDDYVDSLMMALFPLKEDRLMTASGQTAYSDLPSMGALGSGDDDLDLFGASSLGRRDTSNQYVKFKDGRKKRIDDMTDAEVEELLKEAEEWTGDGNA